MYNFQNEIQSLGLNDFQTGEVTIWDPQTQSYYVTYDGRQCSGCWSGWQCWGVWRCWGGWNCWGGHRCGGHHCGGHNCGGGGHHCGGHNCGGGGHCGGGR